MKISTVTKQKFVLAADNKNYFIGVVDQNHKSRVRVDYFGDLYDLDFYEVNWVDENNPSEGYTLGYAKEIKFDVVDWT